MRAGCAVRDIAVPSRRACGSEHWGLPLILREEGGRLLLYCATCSTEVMVPRTWVTRPFFHAILDFTNTAHTFRPTKSYYEFKVTMC